MKYKISNRTALFLFLGFGLIVFIINQLIGFDGAYGQDAYEYLRYSTRVKAFILHGDSLGVFYWPIGYPSIVGLINLILPNVFMAGQIVSILAWSLTCYIGFKFIRLNSGKENRNRTYILYSLIFIGFSPYFFRLGVSTMSDSLCALFILLTFYYYAVFKKNQKYGFILLSVLFGSLGIITRNAAIVIVLIPFLLIAIHLLRNQKWGVILIAASLFSFIVSPTFLTEKSQLLGNETNYSDMFNFSNFFITNKVEGAQGIQKFIIPNGIYAFYGFFHPAFFFLGLPLILLMLLKRLKWNKVILISVILYAIFIGGIYFQNKRFFVIQLPLIIILLYPGFSYLIGLIKKESVKKIFLISLLLVNLGLSLYTTKKPYNQQQIDIEIAHQLKPYEGSTLYLFELDVALKQRGLKFDYVNLWYNKLNRFEKDSYILFNEDRFSRQWKNNNVMINWRKVKHLVEVEKELLAGWFLYRVT